MNTKNLTLMVAVASLALGSTLSVLSADLTHRYQFNPEYDTQGNPVLKDSVGGADATAYGSVYFEDIYDIETGMVIGHSAALDGGGDPESLTDGTFIALPPNIMKSADYTIEAWVSAYGTTTGNERIFDFGNHIGGDKVVSGNEYIVMTWGYAAVRWSDSQYTGNVSFPAPEYGRYHHVVFSYDHTQTKARIYLNGNLVGYFDMYGNPTSFKNGMPNMWLGKSEYGTDPYFYGAYDEFRIYDGVMLSSQVMANYQAGPDTVPTSYNFDTFEIQTDLNPLLNTTPTYTIIGKMGDTTIDLSTDCTMSVDDNKVIQLMKENKFTVVGPGDAILTATYGPDTASVKIHVDETPYRLTHRYSFAEDGKVLDSVGTADGTLYGGAKVKDGILSLDGSGDTTTETGGCFCALPPNILGDSSYTIETWVKVAADNNAGSRIFDFGSRSGASGVDYICVPNVNNAEIGNGGAVSSSRWNGNDAFAIGDGKYHQVVAVYDSAARQARFYCDGNYRTAINNINGNFATPHSWIGKAQWTDPALAADYQEFRIYEGAMNNEAVLKSFVFGPEGEPASITDLTIELGAENIVRGTKVPYSVIANTTDGTRDITPICNLLVANDGVLNLCNGVLCSFKAGTTTFTAQYAGLVASATITVDDSFFALAHRYDFAEDGKVVDTVGTADGTIFGNAKVADGVLVLDGKGDSTSQTDGSFVKLPANILPDGSYSIEAWFKINADCQPQGRIYDFGMSTENFSNALRYTSAASINNAEVRDSDTIHGAPWNPGFVQGDGKLHHIVASYDALNQQTRYYADGVLTAIIAANGNFDTPNCFIGKSQWADPYFSGEIAEFRIYDGIITPEQAIGNYLAGTEEIGSEVAFADLTVSVDTKSVRPNSLVPFRVFGTYDQFTVEMTSFIDAANSALFVENNTPDVLERTAAATFKTLKGGDASFTVNYKDLSKTIAFTVQDTSFVLAHRYSFNDDTYGTGSTIVKDSVGSADGKLFGNAFCMDGVLTLVGDGDPCSMDDGSFVQLPANILPNGSYTIEAWTMAESYCGDGSRIWDFGSRESSVEAQTASGIEYTCVPFVNNAEIKYNGTIYSVKWNPGFSKGDGKYHHVVASYDALTQTTSYYADGVKTAQIVANANFATPNCWIGKSQWTDTHYAGELQEFRIYEGALNAIAVAGSYIAGPDALNEDLSIDSLSITTSDTEVLKTMSFTYSVKAVKGTVNIDVTADKQCQVNILTPSILALDGAGKIKTLAPGTGTFEVTYGGKTATASITVTAPQQIAYNEAIAEKNPTYYWRLGEPVGSIQAIDSISGAIVTNALPVSYGVEGALKGDKDTAVYFDGSCYLGMPNMNFNSDEVTIMAWVKMDGVQYDDHTGIIFTRDAYGNGLTVAYGQLCCKLNNNSAWDIRGELYLEDGQWNLVGVTMKKGRGYELFLGDSKGNFRSHLDTAHAVDICSFTGTFSIGADSKGFPTRAFHGAIDEVAIFPVALSMDDVNEIYQIGFVGSEEPPVEDPVLTWSIDEAGNLVLSWNVGTLETSEDLVNWQAINATSPYEVPNDSDKLFFRVAN